MAERVSVPQDDGVIEVMSVNLGAPVTKKFKVIDGEVTVENIQERDLLLRAIEGSKVVKDEKPSNDDDKSSGSADASDKPAKASKK